MNIITSQRKIRTLEEGKALADEEGEQTDQEKDRAAREKAKAQGAEFSSAL